MFATPDSDGELCPANGDGDYTGSMTRAEYRDRYGKSGRLARETPSDRDCRGRPAVACASPDMHARTKQTTPRHRFRKRAKGAFQAE